MKVQLWGSDRGGVLGGRGGGTFQIHLAICLLLFTYSPAVSAMCMYMCMVHTDLVVALFKLLVYVEKHGKGLGSCLLDACCCMQNHFHILMHMHVCMVQPLSVQICYFTVFMLNFESTKDLCIWSLIIIIKRHAKY